MSFFFLRRLSDQKVEVRRGGRLLDFFFLFFFFILAVRQSSCHVLEQVI